MLSEAGFTPGPLQNSASVYTTGQLGVISLTVPLRVVYGAVPGWLFIGEAETARGFRGP